MRYLHRTCHILLMLCIVLPSISTAEKLSREKEKNNTLSIEITSDRMTSDQKSNKVVFTGKVIAKRGKLIIFSDEMTVYNNEDAKNNRKIEKIVARGHVKMETEGRVAYGDQAVYFEDEGKIVLTGNPRAVEKGNKISGTKMIFFVDEDKFVVEGNEKKRVKLTFHPEKKKK